VNAPAPDPALVAAPVTVPVLPTETIEHAYRRLYPSLVRLAFLLVDTQEFAEEAVQDAFTKAYGKWSRVEQPDAYLRTCVMNACRRVQQRRRRARELPVPPNEDGVMEADHLADVVRSLPSPMREAVVMRYYLQLSDAEIAADLHMAIGTVKSTLHRARAVLRKELS
jgi:RNA polymerase sigma factor (sigma-70 family)